MAQGVASVWLPVEDMERAKAFYSRTLGLTLTKETPDWSEVDANGLMIGLNAREGVGGATDGGAVLTFQPDGSIDDDVAELQGKGVQFAAGGISDHPWGRIATFKDSEGNDLQLFAPPA